jgi:cell division protein YceG involved in septum cleavage
MYKKMIKYKIIIFSILAIGFFSIMGIIYGTFFSAPQKNSELENFIVKRNFTQDQVINTLKTSGFIKNQQAFGVLIDLKGGLNKIKPGGYKISKSMNAWSIANILTQKPYMEWVVIPEGLRKEEIAEILGQALDWNDANKKDWIETATDQKPEYFEGVYFPDTYLISVDEPPLQIAERLRAKFQEEFSPLAKEAIKQNIKWDTA